MKKVLLIILLFMAFTSVMGQVELVPVGHRVYDFLRRMDAKGVIDFNSAVVPVSRREVGEQLRVMSEELRVKSDEGSKSSNKVIELQGDEGSKSSNKVTELQGDKVRLSKNDKMMLEDFMKEFEFEMRRSERASNLESEKDGFKERDSFQEHEGMTGLRKDFVNDNNYINMDPSLKRTGMTGRNFIDDNKYIIKFIDTNVAVWGHLTGGLYQRNGWGDSLGGKKFLAGDLGFEVRGTMFDRVGFAMSYSNGKVFVGNGEDKLFANSYDPFFRTALSLKDDGKFFDHFKGYIRYEVPKRWLSLIVGKESLRQGLGFVDNLFFSGMIPYSMIKLDMTYKAFGYTFSYGNIKGDSMGVNVQNKMISTHRVDVKFAKWIRAGFYESVITSNSAFNFVHFNPLSFITSADLNTGGVETFKSNSLLGFDLELKPYRNVVIQGTLLVDDFNLASINNNDVTANDNKFGYQAGVMWNDAFTLDGLSGVVEYTRIDPFVYTHRDNKQQFTNWGYSMGHQLPPNSDEIAFKFDYNLMPRMSVSVMARFQRSGEGFTFDSLGNIDINYGGYINHGERFYVTNKNTFLQGNRVNRSILTLGLMWEPVRQWVMGIKYMYRMEDLVYAGRKTGDSFFYLNFGVKM